MDADSALLSCEYSVLHLCLEWRQVGLWPWWCEIPQNLEIFLRLFKYSLSWSWPRLFTHSLWSIINTLTYSPFMNNLPFKLFIKELLFMISFLFFYRHINFLLNFLKSQSIVYQFFPIQFVWFRLWIVSNRRDCVGFRRGIRLDEWRLHVAWVHCVGVNAGKL